MPGQDASRPAYAYVRVRDDIRTLIMAGTYGAGALLPSVREITKRWGVSSTTARHALSDLVASGYARTAARRGFVSTGGPDAVPQTGDMVQASKGDNPPATPAVGRVIVRTAHVIAAGDAAALAQGRVSAVDVRHELPPADVALALHVDPVTPVIVRRRIFVDDDGAPIHFRTSYLPTHIAAGTALADHAVVDAPWPMAVAVLSSYAVEASTTQTTARHPTDVEAAALDLRADSAVLVRDDVTHDFDGNPVDFTRNVWPGDSTRLTARYPIPS